VKKISKLVSSSDLKEMNKVIENETKTFATFLSAKGIVMDDFIKHVLEAYLEGGLVAAS
jgi:hypothetical protein